MGQEAPPSLKGWPPSPPKHFLGVPLGFKTSSRAGPWYSQLRRYLVLQCSGNTEASPKGLPRPPFLPSPMGWGPKSNPCPLKSRVPSEGCKPIPLHAFLIWRKGHGTGRLWDIRSDSTQSHHAGTTMSLDINSSALPYASGRNTHC